MLSVRTNNDIEGWHHALNRRAAGRCGLPFYLLVSLLNNEARLVSLQIRLVSERKLKRIQKAAYRHYKAGSLSCGRHLTRERNPLSNY